MVKSTTVSITPATHASKHSVGGTDPLIAPVLVSGHHATHEGGGADEITILNTCDTQVLNDGQSSSWVDVDCSSVVGAGKHLVILRVDMGGSYDKAVVLRTKGDTHNQVPSYGVESAACNSSITHGYSGYLICITDTNGYIQYKGEVNGHASLSIIGWV